MCLENGVHSILGKIYPAALQQAGITFCHACGHLPSYTESPAFESREKTVWWQRSMHVNKLPSHFMATDQP